MRAGLAICVAFLLLTGCTGQESATRGRSIDPVTAASIEASSGSGIPAHLTSLEPTDADGRTPDQAVLALIDAKNSSQWEVLYSMYATPTPTLEVAVSEWARAQEKYRDFAVLETRITASDAAFVRVAYEAQATPVDGAAYSVEMQDPGEWWPLHKVAGRWKVQWMPRQ